MVHPCTRWGDYPKTSMPGTGPGMKFAKKGPLKERRRRSAQRVRSSRLAWYLACHFGPGPRM